MGIAGKRILHILDQQARLIVIKAAIAITIPICTALLFSPKRRQKAITMTAPTISATQMGSGTSSVIASSRSLRAAVKPFTLTTACS